MFNWKIVSTNNVTYFSYFWNIVTYTSLFNSTTNYNNQTIWMGENQINNSNTYADHYVYSYSTFSFKCPTTQNLVDCRCNCNRDIIGAYESANRCQCNFDINVFDSIECAITIDCSVPINATTSLTDNKSYSYDSMRYYFGAYDLELNETSVSCFRETKQYMFSCKYSVFIGVVDYNISGFKFKPRHPKKIS